MRLRVKKNTMKKINKISKCCQAEMLVSTADDGTSCFICSKCNNPTDPTPSKNEKSWEKSFDGEHYNAFISVQYAEDCKNFIRTELQKARQEGYEEGLNLRKDYNDPELIARIGKKICQESLQQLLDEGVEDKNEGYDMRSNCDANYVNGFNASNQEWRALISKKLKE